MSLEFNSSFYLEQYPDVASAGIDPQLHFQNYGAAEGRAPNATLLPVAQGFDDQAYRDANSDVDAAVEAGQLESGYQHWVLYGRFEESRPEATFNGGTLVSEAAPASIDALFNAEEYLDLNPDVAAAGIDAYEHFINYGAAEGRAPNAAYEEIADKFNSQTYLDENPDINGSGLTPYQHWVLYGQFEPSRSEATLTDGRTVSEVLDGEDTTVPTFMLTEALAEDELPEEYELSDATADLGELAVADVAAAQAEAQAIVDGAVNAAELTLEASYTLEDSAEVLLSEDNAELVAGAGTITVTDETLTREQYDALSQLGNVDLEGVAVENTAPEAVEAAADVAEDATFEGQLEANDPDVADQGDELTYALAEGQAEVEGFTLNADGSYSFNADQEAFQALQAGESEEIVISYTVTDSEGATSTNTLTLTVTGADDAPVVSIDNETALLDATQDPVTDNATVFTDEDAITDVDGFGGGATVTLSYDEAVEAAGQYGTPRFDTTAEFRVVRDGNEFTLIAKAGQNGFTTATTIGTVTPVGVEETGENTGVYTQTGYTLALNGDVSPEVLTALLKEWSVQEAADQSNTQLTVSIASEGGAEPVEFVRSIGGTNAGGVTLTGADGDLEAELTAGDLGTVDAATPFAPFSSVDGNTVVDFSGKADTIPGMEIVLSSTNAADAFSLAADNGQFEVVGEQLIISEEVVANITGLGTNQVTITARQTLPEGFNQDAVDTLLQNLLLDMQDATGDRTVSLNVTSGDGLSSDSLSRDITVLGEFTEVTLAEIAAADVEADPESVITINGNTILDVNDFDDELDIQAQIDAGNLVVEGDNPIRVIVDADGADLSQVTGLDLLGDLQIQSVDVNAALTLNAAQVDFLSTAGTVKGDIKVVGLENNLDADLSELSAKEITVELNTNGVEGDVVFTGKLAGSVDAEGDHQGPALTVSGGSNFFASAAVLSGQQVTNTQGGQFIVTDLDGAAAYDLRFLSDSNGSDHVLATLAIGVTTLDEGTQLGNDLAITVPQNSELVLTADQANGANISGGNVTGDGNKGGSVTVLGLADGVDLSNIAGSNILAGAVNASQSDRIVQFRAEDEEAEEGVIENVTLGDFFIVQVQDGATLRIDESTANNAIITGAGNVEVNVDHSEALDLSEITVDGDKTVEVTSTVDLSEQPDVDFADFDISVDANAKLTLTAAQASGLTITGESFQADDAKVRTFVQQQDQGGSVVIELDGEAAYDLSNITAGAASAEEAIDAGTLTATVAATTELDEATDLGDFTLELSDEANVELTLSAAQATGRVITGDANDSVIVEGLAADTDLSGIDSDIVVTANVAESVDISGNENLGNVTEFVVANDAVLTLSARQADDQEVTPAGDDNDADTAAPAIVISGSLEAVDGNDDGVVDEDDYDGIDNTVAANQVDLTQLASGFTFEGGSLVVGEGVSVRLTAEQASGKVITGAGNVLVTDLKADTDLSGITVEGIKATSVTENLTLDSAANLGDFAVEVTENNTLTLTAAQAAALETLEGDGEVEINGTNGADTLDFSAKDWGIAELTINGGGGADVLTAPADFAGTVTLNGGTNADRFEVTSGTVIIGDFQTEVDELLVSEGATAVMTLQADTDLSTLQAAELIDIQGTLRIDLNGFNLTATEDQLANIEVADTLDNLLAIAQEVSVAGKLALTASSVTATDIGEDGEEVNFIGADTEDAATAIDFTDDAATLTFAELEAIAATPNGADLSLTDADAITVTGGVTDNVQLALVDSELNDADDTIEVEDGSALTLTLTQLNNLDATITADADGEGEDATVSVTLAADDDVTRATDLVDTFDVSGLTNGQSVTIEGFEVGDGLDTGLSTLVTGALDDDNQLEAAVNDVDGNAVVTYELVADGSETATVTLTGITTGDADFTATNGVIHAVEMA